MADGGENKKTHGGKLELPSKELLVARKCVLVETLLGKGAMGAQGSVASHSSGSSSKSSTSKSFTAGSSTSSNSDPTAAVVPSSPPAGESKVNKRAPKPIKKLGPSAVLGRVKEFLPQLKKSNEALLEKAKTDPASVSVEAPLQDDNQQHVEVSVALVPNEATNDDSDIEEFVTSPTSTLAKQLTAMEVEANNNPIGSNAEKSPSKKALIMEMD